MRHKPSGGAIILLPIVGVICVIIAGLAGFGWGGVLLSVFLIAPVITALILIMT